MLDAATGELHVESIPLTLGPRFIRGELSAAPVQATSQVVNEPHHSYSLGEQQISGQIFLLVLYFFGEKLESIDLAHPGKEFGASWVDGSEEGERRRKAWHDRWLREQTGRVSHNYTWGAIHSEYDPRSGGSSITIRYSWRGQPWPPKGHR